MHPDFRDFALNRLPIPEVARLRLPEPRNYSNLRTLVTKPIKPSDKLFSLANSEHGLIVANWIHRVNTPSAKNVTRCESDSLGGVVGLRRPVRPELLEGHVGSAES